MRRAAIMFLVGSVLTMSWSGRTTEPACTTDSECALLCPAQDPGCDGGPEGAR